MRIVCRFTRAQTAESFFCSRPNEGGNSVSIVPRPTPKNRLLAALSPSDLALLEPHASDRSFELREVFIEPHRPISELYFPETGMMSVVTPDHAEIGVIGREGLVGISVLLGVQSSPL